MINDLIPMKKIGDMLGSGLFYFVLLLGLIPYAISRIKGYHFYDDTKDESVDWTPWDEIEGAAA